MNAKVGHCVNLYSAMEHQKIKIEQLEFQLNQYIVHLSEKELGEYMTATEKIDEKIDKKRGE